MGTRHCADCGYRASARARFCERCGAALTPSAKPLRAPSALEARILAERTAIEGERKQVTVMYADIVGSMELTRALDGERWGLVLDRFLGIAAGAVHAYAGTVNQFTGDGLLAVFGAPLAHEDHARRACLAVLDLQREVAALALEVQRRDGVTFAARCGLNSGEVIVGSIGDDVHMDFVPIGNTTALGKRIESLAPAGSIAISAATAALVEGEFELRELGVFDVKGGDVPQRVLELVGRGTARTRLQAIAATRGLSPFFGRDAESAELRSALDDALAGDGRAVAVVGEPGVGKSRLVHEFVTAAAARGVSVSATRGLAHGRYVPLLAILALYRDWFGVTERDAPEVARGRIEDGMLALDPSFADDLPLLFEFLGVPDHDRPLGRANPATRRRQHLDLLTRAVRARSRREPAVLVVEDLQWLDDASAAFLEALVAAVAGTRSLLVSTSRPEHRVAWAGRDPHTSITLGPLDPEARGDLLTALLGGDRSLDAASALIDARAGGNPFFIEEIVQALAENDHLTGSRGAYGLPRELDALVLPATVQAGLAARLDRLPAPAKALLQTMSVIGTEIPRSVLDAISELPGEDLDDAVELLAHARWVVPGDGDGGRRYVFKHPLAQEVAYASQLSDRRACAHRAVAAAIEEAYPGSLDERAALLAHHCEASGDQLRAARWHARAAAWTESTSPADSLRHWRRVREVAGQLAASPEREALATQAGIGVLGLVWRLGMSAQETAAIYTEGAAGGERSRLDLKYAGILIHSGREREGLELFREVSGYAVVAGDRGLALTAATGVAYASWLAGSVREGVESMDQALRLAGDDPELGTGLVFVCPLAHAYAHRGQGRGYVGDLAGARLDYDRVRALAREYQDPEAQAHALANLALLEGDAEDFEAALRHAAEGLELAERTGNTIGVLAASTAFAVAEAGAGRPAEAVARARQSLAMIAGHDFGRYYEPVLHAAIARSLLALGEPEEALVTAEDAMAMVDGRGLATCGLSAPITLAEVLVATGGAAADRRANALLERARRVARAGGTGLFERRIDRELARLSQPRAGGPS